MHMYMYGAYSTPEKGRSTSFLYNIMVAYMGMSARMFMYVHVMYSYKSMVNLKALCRSVDHVPAGGARCGAEQWYV